MINAGTSCLASKAGSDDIFNFILRKRHRWSNKWQENANTSRFWPMLTFGGSPLFPLCPGNGQTEKIYTDFVWCVKTHDMT